MKKLIAVLYLSAVLLMLLSACKKVPDSVSITVDRTSYTPLMSSVQGITMTPVFTSSKKAESVEYHWTAEKGTFLHQGTPAENELTNQGEPVLWSSYGIDNPLTSFHVNLEVIDKKSGKVLAKSLITITAKDIWYTVQQ